MANKEKLTVYVINPIKVEDFTADANFTTDIITWNDFEGFSLNVWFPVLNGTSPSPTIDIEVSNSTDPLSFQPLINSVNVELVNLPVPRLWEIASIEARYIRFKYTATGVAVGSTITFDFNRLIL